MPCATCQNHSSPCCYAHSREVSNNSSVTISMPPCTGSAPLPHSRPHPSPPPPEEDFCAQISLWSWITRIHHYPNTHHNPFCKARNKGKYSSSSVKLVHRHKQAMGLCKRFASLLKKLIHVWKFKYSSKSISLYLTSTTACGSLQLPPETRGTISTASTSFGCPDGRLDSRGVLSGREPDLSPAGDRGDQSSWHDQNRGTAGTLRRSRSFWTQHQPGLPNCCTWHNSGWLLPPFFLFYRKKPHPFWSPAFKETSLNQGAGCTPCPWVDPRSKPPVQRPDGTP